MTDLVPIRRALLSVSDKTDLVPFATALAGRGVELLSTGGTATALESAGLSVTRVEDLTGVAEMLDGRVKTLHPAVHAGLLAKRDHSAHLASMKSEGFEPIDLICVNLYPFERTVSQPGVSFDEAIENIDIGGPAMIRAAAKNAEWVTVVTTPRQYDRVAAELSGSEGATGIVLRKSLAADAFARTAAYDRAIAAYLAGPDRAFPPVLSLDYTIADELRYGENPHQSAAVYRDPASGGPNNGNTEPQPPKPQQNKT
ncbi:MAG: bifunctional phosphoribosylaminoimidazolecarboxamide formyltransferase/IMP cyclohydrolase, partial [Planctomycetota bacterium]